jgi:hypothetical protein
MPFREFFMHTVRKSILNEGLDSNSYVSHSVETLVSYGGSIALDLARVLMEVFQEKSNICSDQVLEVQG